MTPRGLRPLAALVVCLCALVGCGTGAAPPAPPSASVRDTGALAARMETALAGRDRDSFLTNFAPTTASQRLGGLWYDNLTRFETTIQAQPDGLAVGWSVPGDRAASTQTLRPDMAFDGGRTVIVDNPLAPDTPAWTLASVTVDTSPAGSVVSTGLTAARRAEWSARLAGAVRLLADAGLAPLDDGWNGRLVVEIPADEAGYRRVGGDPDASEAVTSCLAGAIRVDVNPRALSLGTAELDVLLLHEGVHLATASCLDPSPTWEREGLAEWGAARAYPATAAHDRSLVVSWLAAHPLPSALPADADFAGDRDAVWAAYALSRVAIDAMVSHLGQPAAMRMLAGTALDPGDAARVTTWYVDALRALTKQP